VALSGNFKINELGLSLPSAYIRLRRIVVENIKDPPARVAFAELECFASPGAATSGAQPVKVLTVTLPAALANTVVAQGYAAVKALSAFAGLADVF
jgi:hypothetical protein